MLKKLLKTGSVDPNYKEHKVIVITGCDTGLGLEIAKYCLKWGFYVVACCLNIKSQGALSLKELGADVVHLDVCNEEMTASLVQKLVKLQKDGKDIWCLINNAAVMTYAKAEWLTWSLVQQQLLVNLSGTIQITRKILPLLRLSKGLISTPYMSVYCSSKSGLEAFSKAVRLENLHYGVNVIVIRPCSFANKTSILKQNAMHLKKMEDEMDPLSLVDFKEEIDATRNIFEEAFSAVDNNQDINDKILIKNFRCAIESPNPDREYTSAPNIVKILLKLVKSLPDSVLDQLILRGIPNKIINLGKSS